MKKKPGNLWISMFKEAWPLKAFKINLALSTTACLLSSLSGYWYGGTLFNACLWFVSLMMHYFLTFKMGYCEGVGFSIRDYDKGRIYLREEVFKDHITELTKTPEGREVLKKLNAALTWEIAQDTLKGIKDKADAVKIKPKPKGREDIEQETEDNFERKLKNGQR